MQKTKKFFLLSLIFFSLILSGCSISLKTSEGGNDGGVYLSGNKGNTWQRRILIPTTSGNPGSIANLNNFTLTMDPSDNKALYFASMDNGLYYTYDQGASWSFVSALGRQTIRDVQVDPKDKCNVYVAIDNKVYKSVDCTRTWSQVYYDTEPETLINSIAIDHYNSNNIYIGTSRGEIIKSEDQAGSWRTIERFGNYVRIIRISPFDSRILMAATRDKGLYRSFDSGESWYDLDENLKDFNNSNKIRDIQFSLSEPGLLFMATNYGLIKTTNHGDNWEKIELITPEKESVINALAIGPQDPQEIYYVTDTTFYRSLDGGLNWSTKKLPSTRPGRKLLVDPKNSNLVYLTVLQIDK